MFFEPPKVKSLSRYAEYGAYPGNRAFLIALAVAITAHLAIIAIYSMMPGEQVIKIPVRVLNIKFSGGSAGNGVSLPQASAMPETQFSMPSATPEQKAAEEDAEKTAAATIDKALKNIQAKSPAKPEKPHTVSPGAGKTVILKAPPVAARKPKADLNLSVPKKYVRESEITKAAADARAKGGGNGSGVNGVAGGTETVSRYTQTISQWIQNHQDYARAAYKEASEGQGSIKGQTVIRIRINRDGHIINNTLEHTSGNELIDQIAGAMVNASDPVPAVPSDYPSDSQLEFLIPVQVNLANR